jgi:hypothetical protein
LFAGFAGTVEETGGAATVLQPANNSSAAIKAPATARPSVSLPDVAFTALGSLRNHDSSFQRTFHQDRQCAKAYRSTKAGTDCLTFVPGYQTARFSRPSAFKP